MNRNPRINVQFSHTEQNHINQLLDRTNKSSIARHKRNKASVLDEHLDLIITKREAEWSYQRIADYLRNYNSLSKINKSTVQRRIKKFYKEN